MVEIGVECGEEQVGRSWTGHWMRKRIGKVTPLPVAAIHSTKDEFVPLAEIQRVMDRAHDPKRLWLIAAQDHRFSGSEAELTARLLDAIAWMKALPR